jgi:hypothetical protein
MKRLGCFAGLVVASLALLLLPWPGLARAWTAGWWRVSNVLVAPQIGGPTFYAQLSLDDREPWMIGARLIQARTGETVGLLLEHRFAYVIAATYAAVCASAVVVGWGPRLWWKAALGLSACLAFGLAVEAGILRLWACEVGWSPLPHLAHDALAVLLFGANSMPVMNFAIPTGIWAVVRR